MSDDAIEKILNNFTTHYRPGLDFPNSELHQATAQQIRAVFEKELDTLKTELREYYKKYPDADYNDISGYIIGFKARMKLREPME